MINKKPTLIVSHNEMVEGLFGMVFLHLFEILPILENEDITVSNLYWDIKTKHYGALFPYILEYNSQFPKNRFQIKKKIKFAALRKQQPKYVLGDNFEKLNELFFKYFKIPKLLNDIAVSYKLDDFLGIHYRGTDKINHYDNTVLIKNDFYEIIDSYITHNNTTKIFIASDEKDILNYFKTKYPNIEFKSSRSFNDMYPHQSNPNIEQNAQEAMVDMLCLSKCKTVLKASSALSAWPKVINPKLKIYRINALRMFADIPYFPDAYIPLLKNNDNYSEKCNSILNKVQQEDWSYEYGEKFNDFFIRVRKPKFDN